MFAEMYHYLANYMNFNYLFDYFNKYDYLTLFQNFYLYLSQLDYKYLIKSSIIFAFKSIALLNLLLNTLIHTSLFTLTTFVFHYFVIILNICLRSFIHVFKQEALHFGLSNPVAEQICESLLDWFKLYEPMIDDYSGSFSKIFATGFLIYLCYKKTVETVKNVGEMFGKNSKE